VLPRCAQIISFLRRDAERKDELIESLKGTIKQQRDMFAEQRTHEAAEQTAAMEEMENGMRSDFMDMQERLEAAEDEQRTLRDYKDKKATYDANLAESERQRLDEEDGHREAMEAMERKFFEEKAKLQKVKLNKLQQENLFF